MSLGVRTNFEDYSPSEKKLIREAQKIYYPTTFYADLLDAMGIALFPSYHTYKCVQDKIKQTALFQMLEISHPATRVFYGNRQQAKIKDHFRFPFIAKVPRGSAMGRGVFLIENESDLTRYCKTEPIAYIQDYLPIDRDIRVVVIGRKAVHAYWRIAGSNDFRTNLAVGGTVSLNTVPGDTAHDCRWDDVGIDI